MAAPQCDDNKIANMRVNFKLHFLLVIKACYMLVPFGLWPFATGLGRENARMLQKEFFVIKRLL